MKIIKVLGTPKKEKILEMNPEYNLNEFKAININPKPLSKVINT